MVASCFTLGATVVTFLERVAAANAPFTVGAAIMPDGGHGGIVMRMIRPVRLSKRSKEHKRGQDLDST